MGRIIKDDFKKVSVWTLILSNLVPLIGVFFWDWNIFQLLFAYWCESAVIGVFTILRLVVKKEMKFILFFIIHFGAFMQAHLLFLIVFFSSDASVLPEAGLASARVNLKATFFVILPAVVAMVISHGVSYYSNFLKNKEYVGLSPVQIMIAPYPRIFLMHVTVIFGGFLAVMLQNLIGGLIVLVILKTILDFFGHTKERLRFKMRRA